MVEPWEDGTEPSSLKIEAAALITRVLSDPTDQNLAACKAWYDRGEQHRSAFSSVIFTAPVPDEVRRRIETALGQNFPTLPGLPNGQQAAPASERAATQPKPWGNNRSRTDRLARPRTRVQRAIWIGIGATASAAIIALAIGLTPNLTTGPMLTSAKAENFETGHGVIRTFSLADGTAMTLDSDSRVEVTMDRARRHALLRQGRARFIVKQDSRPFTIEAAGGEVVSDHATVDVELDSAHRVDVRLREGVANVQSGGEAAQPLVIDRPMTYSSENPRASADAAPPAETRDWPEGWADYRTVSLAKLIGEANRYAKTPIILDDPDLGSLQATGRFKLTDTETFVSRIAEPFGLRVTHRKDGIHLSR
ncbi:FecR family protein [uncultured Sphingomonas sp.]|uniref:FecR family protein n=1 Tax=uncultured Sphingomonas sp. TaxID=158754 RepID=UPI002616FA6B|nr:FecR domain-containing protein [uncultured Sphingomonas sp.]